MAISVERDERWGQLGAGLGGLLAGIIQGADQKRISRGVAQIDQDPSIQGPDKYAAVLKQYGPEGADMYSQIEQARVHQEQLQAAQEARQSEDVAWPAMLQGAPGPIEATPAGAALGLPQRLPSPTDRGGQLAPGVKRSAGGGLTMDGQAPTGMLPGGIPTYNPGNIKINARTYASYPSQQAGVDAIGDWGIKAQQRHGLTTVRQLIDDPVHGYAPQSDPGNRGKPLVAEAAKRMGVDPDQPVNLEDPETRKKWTGAILAQEGDGSGAGRPFNKTTVRADDLANDAMESVSALRYGQMQRQQLAQAIEKANPNAPAHVKMMAFERAAKMLAPEERMQWELDKAKLNYDAKLAVAQMQSEGRERLEQERAGRPQFFMTPEGKIIAGNPMTGQAVETQLPAGSTPVGRGAGGAAAVDRLSPAQTEFWAKYLNQVGSLPIAIGRNKAAATQILAKAADLGGDPGKMVEAVGTVKADQHSLMAATKLADAATSFEATALKNLDIATKELAGAAPTGLGPFINKWIETGETQIGNKNVPPSVTAVLTFANEYAKVMSGSTGAQGATVDARREAAELFSPYFNKGQWDEVARIARADMANRKASLYEQVDTIRTRLRETGSGRPSAAPEAQGTPTTAPSAPAAPAGGWPTPNASQVELLHKNDTPELRQWFDHKFGPGAAERVLK